MGITRRGLILGASALALAVATRPRGAWALVEGVRILPPDPTPVAGFAGPALVTVEMLDARFEIPSPVPVPPDARVVWARDPVARLGGQGLMDGTAGNFSGRRNHVAPWLFTPWPRRVGALQAADRPLPGDDPAQWRVRLDGAPARVLRVLRKTGPAATLQTAPGRRENARRHLVTLELDRPVPPGAMLKIAPPGGVPLSLRRAMATPSPVLHHCHPGYALDGPKKVYAGLWLGQDAGGAAGATDAALSGGRTWVLRDQAGAAVAEGPLALVKPAAEPHGAEGRNFSGCDIWEADFSRVTTPGRYRLEVEGVGATPHFAIARNPYRRALRLAARWYFHQRSGCAIAEPQGEGRVRPRNGHPADGLEVIATGVQLGRTSEGFRAEPYAPGLLASLGEGGPRAPRAWGGWHDAADWDRRIQHMEPVQVMAAMVELFPTVRALDLNIPESGCSFADPAVAARRDAGDRGDGATVLPDLIHEALWGLSLWRRTQGPNGEIIGGVEYSSDGIMGSVSWDPVQRAYAYAPEEWSAYTFVGGAAALGRVIAQVCGDRVLGAALIAEAVAAWDWAEGERARLLSGYAPDEAAAVARARIRAAATLFRATGEAAHAAPFEAGNPFLPRQEAEPSLNRADCAWAAADYLRAAEEGLPADPELVAEIRGWLSWQGGNGGRMGRDYGLHTTTDYPWGPAWYRFGPGSNWRARRAALAVIAGGGDWSALAPLAIEGMWFALGCNPANVSFIQGLGLRDFADPASLDLAAQPTVPGMPSFGVAAGPLRAYERDRIADALWPADPDAWPEYARIFESRTVIACAEHGMRSNAMEWLFACGLVTECLEGEGRG
ncbi:hypothetical protein HMH01_07590 [Halovulum dunhuangense]|uniref:Cellulase-like Ig domain-containing protein n=1 Tax=Halovulum dunhuangense TaxID=1505036 RepID=A0A849L254_9RHOB|nr:glycoside hydrolase family 9 protein [Halovulum dunhuangense]NNU80301.1 hypothetical protein [Halovulum dunhuangense]